MTSRNSAFTPGTNVVLPPGEHVVWDIDNCLADDSWRLQFIDWRASGLHRWERYHALCGIHLDDILEYDRPANVETFRGHADRGRTPIFITARPEAARQRTQRWLAAHFACPVTFLFMRPDQDERDSAAFKSDVLSALLRDAHPDASVVAAYDDYAPVIDAYRQLGINAVKLVVHQFDAHTPTKPIYLAQPRNSTPSIADSSDIDSLADLRPTHVTVEERAALLSIAREARQEEPAQTAPQPKGAAAVLLRMAQTFAERNAVYQDNYRIFGRVMHAWYPEGLAMQSAEEHEIGHLWMLLLVKASRFVCSGHTHVDSIHDLAVYAAIIESVLQARAQREEAA